MKKIEVIVPNVFTATEKLFKGDVREVSDADAKFLADRKQVKVLSAPKAKKSDG